MAKLRLPATTLVIKEKQGVAGKMAKQEQLLSAAPSEFNTEAG